MLKKTGKAAIVVPTGFLTAKKGIDKKIREKLVDEKILSGVVSMPSNIFAKTTTNVSILFINKENKDNVVLIDATKLGKKYKEGSNQKTVLSDTDEQQIIDTFANKEALDEFSVVLNYEDIATKNYSFSAGQYFDVKIKHIDISEQEFEVKIESHMKTLKGFFEESEKLESKIIKKLSQIKYE